jgi:nickel superoxide dismutase
MNLADRALSKIQRMLPVEEASAHCDIPCGIYDPHALQVAALTVIRMHQLIEALPKPDGGADKQAMDTYIMQISRYTAVKEEHAKIAEQEIVILWTDYFKPEHLEKHSNLHDVVWKATKLTSTVKQQINMQAAQDLLASAQQIAEIFWDTKGVKTRRQTSNQTAGGEFVYPVAG